MNKKRLNRQLLDEVIQFLDSHLLDPTPGNYAFAFLYVTNATGLLHEQVSKITDGGVRLAQSDVDELMGQTSETSGSSEASEALQQELRLQALSFADLTQKALQEAGAFGQELAQGADQLASGFDLGGVLRAMIERTAEMERKLTETRNETERLRLDLDAAKDDASRDALTNLPNRRAMERKIKAVFEASGQVTIAFCDIDHFKSINDRFGHAVGDRVLKAVAETLSEELAPHSVARFGGEEFVGLFSEVSEADAFDLVEKARLAVSRRSFRVRDTDEALGQVTFSAGIATSTTDPSQALGDADAALYEAKGGGRNRTISKALSAA